MFKTAFLQKMSITWKFYDRFFSKISVNKPQTACKRAQQLPRLLRQPQADHSLLVGAVVYWNLSNDILLFIEEIHMSNKVAIICSKIQNLKQSVDSNLPISVPRPTNIPVWGRVVVFNCQRSRYANWWKKRWRDGKKNMTHDSVNIVKLAENFKSYQKFNSRTKRTQTQLSWMINFLVGASHLSLLSS